MNTRLETCFANLKQQNKNGLITFITAGDPDYDTSKLIVNGLAESGADIIELGMPFSDPMADGPAIQAAGLRAIKKGMTLKKTLMLVESFRQHNANTPIVLMGYYNPIHHYGVSQFVADAKQAGVDGLIVVDLPPEEDDELCHPAIASGLHWIRLITPTTDEQRLPQVLANASGFVYYVAVAGITGMHSAVNADIAEAVARIKASTHLPVAVGFGIKTPDQAAAIAQYADAVVVGSALVDLVKQGLDNHAESLNIVKETSAFTCSLRDAIDADR